MCCKAGLCEVVNEEHARHLPTMNGIKEDIESVRVFDSGTAIFQESLSSLAERFKKLQFKHVLALPEHCKEHFGKEEKEELIYINFVSSLEGLVPHDATHYLELITQSNDKTRVSSMILMLVESDSRSSYIMLLKFS
ncbi:hypothetical protein LIER_34977 [Lithospermum erythrorhizon]|uniref:Uncharacterized protein n=1 Tax=Lithospermum erythrorhizon TaxID=34254 RepID=A0AAV3NHI0_LITER